jgi:hypothetical protein
LYRPFGYTLGLKLSLSRPWLSLGPGWAALAGALSTGYADFDLSRLAQLLGLWLLVDPILGTLWDLSVQQGLWRRFSQAQLPRPPTHGFYLPYAQPEAAGGRLVLLLRRIEVWWRETYWPEAGDKVTAYGLGILLALLIGFFLGPLIFGLTLLAIFLTLLTGQSSPDLTATEGGRLQSVVQFFLPWLMGLQLWSTLTPLSLVIAICYWATYLGGLRMLGNHRQANILFSFGQVAAVLVLLALRLLPGAAIVSVLFVAQQLIKTRFRRPTDFLLKVQPYLVLSIIATGYSLGSL